MYPKSLEKLIEDFKRFPGIGEKTAERLAFYAINAKEEVIKDFADNLLKANLNIGKCQICHHIAENDICSICENKSRNDETLCVVEDSKSVVMLEKAQCFKGNYHVLDGLISPIDGIMPNDLNINKLIERIEKGNYKEVIMALKPTIEGETTFSYICKMLEGSKIQISKIAYGLPMGTDIEYVDYLTLERAIEDRKNVS